MIPELQNNYMNFGYPAAYKQLRDIDISERR